MGWTTDPESQQATIESLNRLGIMTKAVEVSTLEELESTLTSLRLENWTLWPNAYEVAIAEGSSETAWIADRIEEQGLPMIGNKAHSLKTVMLKDTCQYKLQQHGVAIPSFLAVETSDLPQLSELTQTQGLEFPLFVKPNALSSSKGVSQRSVVYSAEQLEQQVSDVGKQYGFPVMIEEYLPGQDITVAVFMTPETPTVLATYYDTEIYEDPGAVLDYDIRQRDWNDGKWLRVVDEPEILEKIERVVIPACHAVDVSEFTRIDCRMDRNGNLKAFDINGLPGLEHPFSTTVWQMIVKMADKPELHAYDTLISLVLYCAATQQQLKVPHQVEKLAKAYIAAEQSPKHSLTPEL